MKVLVRSFPPNLNANYGGILQSWALQAALRRIGLEAFADSSSSTDRGTFLHRARVYLTGLIFRLIPSKLLPKSAGLGTALHRMDRRLLEFAPRHIRLRALYSARGRVLRKSLKQFDGFVSGSDQVFRPDYVDVPSFLFDFAPTDFAGPLVSYAASFGSDSPRYSPELIEKTSPLARRLTAVSVREASGVDKCAELWGVVALQLVDPTLLVAKADYLELIDASVSAVAPGTLVVYVLDQNARKSDIARRVALVRGRTISDIRGNIPGSMREYRERPETYDRPSVEQWLRTLAEADCVITDSFHGCVFSIIFERPFIVLPNEKRGLARFTSLLEMFGLSNRIAASAEEAEEIARVPIDWSDVRSRMAIEQERAFAFLGKAFGVAWEQGVRTEASS